MGEEHEIKQEGKKKQYSSGEAVGGREVRKNQRGKSMLFYNDLLKEIIVTEKSIKHMMQNKKQ